VTFTLSNSAQEGAPITFASPAGFSVARTKPQVFGFAGSATNCPLQLFPNKTCKLTVEFIPAAKGVASSTLTISDNAANADPSENQPSPHQTIPLSGSGE
jgi:hypothetical protein